VTVVQQVVGGGSGVTEYATLAALITASEGTLAAGYYEVTETPPVTHPLYPRIVTYWDGADFEPQISSGFESRPGADTGVTYDFLEDSFRRHRAVGEIFTGETSLTSALAIGVRKLGIGNQNTYKAGALNLWGTNAPQHGVTAPNLAAGTKTIIFAGKSLGLAVGTKAIAGIGGEFGFGWFTLCDVRSSAAVWDVSYYGGDFNTGVARRAGGDVVIAHYNHGANTTTLWINGAKYTESRTLNILANSPIGFGNSPSNSFSWDLEADVQYLSVSSLAMDDTAAAAWTAWLQDRYGIPTL